MHGKMSPGKKVCYGNQDIVFYLERSKQTVLNNIKQTSKLLDRYEKDLLNIQTLIDQEIDFVSSQFENLGKRLEKVIKDYKDEKIQDDPT